MVEVKLSSRIVSNPLILRGKPIVKGTRISVESILELLSSGWEIKDILEEFPQLKREDVLSCIRHAKNLASSEEIVLIRE